MKRRTPRTKASPLGDQFRVWAKAYRETGQEERALGLEQAADAADGSRAPLPPAAASYEQHVEAICGSLRAILLQLGGPPPMVTMAVGPAQPFDPGRVLPTLLRDVLPDALTEEDEAPPSSKVPAPPEDGSIGRGERLVLTCVVQGMAVSRTWITVQTGLKRRRRDACIQHLEAAGLVTTDALVRATALGIGTLGAYEPLPVGHALLDHWRARLPESERGAFDVIRAAGAAGTTRVHVSEATGLLRRRRDAVIAALRQRSLVIALPSGGVRLSAEMLASGGSR